MVTQFPIDYMHVVLHSIVGKINYWARGPYTAPRSDTNWGDQRKYYIAAAAYTFRF